MAWNESAWKGLGRVAVLGGLAAALLLGGLGGVHSLRAATGCAQCPSPVWHAVETANFRILAFGAAAAARSTADGCERMRDELSRRWLPTHDNAAWSPKCELVLHPSDEAYLREVGPGGRSTLGSAIVNRQQGRVVQRRIDIRATRTGWQAAALAHEMTHVILADHFTQAVVPRWVDEGVAILADPAEKQARHRVDLERAMATRGEFRVLELLALSDYPPAGRWGTFYGQSASLVEYLVERGGEGKFIEFVQTSLQRGYEAGLQQTYHFGVAELEHGWKNKLRGSATPSSAGRITAGQSSRGQIAVVQPTSSKRP